MSDTLFRDRPSAQRKVDVVQVDPLDNLSLNESLIERINEWLENNKEYAVYAISPLTPLSVLIIYYE